MISVIVPVYKVEAYLRQSLDSILGQTYKDLDIILIVDGSPDRCGDICETYAQKDSRIRVFHTENKGLSAARNLGLREARGEYIGFVDSDDWIEPDMYKILLNRLEETGSNISVCDYKQEPDSFEKEFKPVEVIYEGVHALIALLDRKINYNVWNKLFRKELFQDNCFPEGQNYEDIAIMHRIMYEAGRVAVIPELGYHYRVRADSITSNYSAKNLIDHADAYLNSYAYLNTCCNKMLAGREKEILSVSARGISIVWRWWHQCNNEEKTEFIERIGELHRFTRANFPLFGYRSWPGYLRLSTAFMHSKSRVSFAVLYILNQGFRKLWPRKCAVIKE